MCDYCTCPDAQLERWGLLFCDEECAEFFAAREDAEAEHA